VSWKAFSVIYRERVWHKDAVTPFPNKLFKIYSIHLGFLAFEIYMFKKRGEPLALWIHHILDAVGSAGIMLYRECAFFPTAFLVSEATIVPQNALTTHQIFGFDKGALYGFLLIVRTLFYLAFRTFCGPGSIRYGFSNSRLDIERLKKVNPVVSGLSTLNILVISMLNAKWSKIVFSQMINHLRGTKATAQSGLI
jgi:hypothetical protein